jgi:signal transduction histidine kinase
MTVADSLSEGHQRGRKPAPAAPFSDLLEMPAGTAILLAVAVGAAVLLACALWRFLVGPVPLSVPLVATLTSVIVALPLILFLQHVIHNLAASKRDLTRLTAQLGAATAEAELASQAKTEFLARMSHELRTPLNAVIGYSELLIEDAEQDGLAQHLADLKRIHGAGRHLLSLIDDVLDLSKIEAGRMDVVAAPIDLDKFVDDIVAATQPAVRRNRNELRVQRGSNLGTIIGDATKLRHVTLNLMSNAAKFTENGLITLAVARERMRNGDWISIAVSDTGIGISAQNLAKLFTSFAAAEPGMTSKYGGNGLGLALSQRLCRLMGGEITAESAPGRGSRFVLRVLAADAPD